jgi:hypothetical protein
MSNPAVLFSNKINKLLELGNRLTKKNIQLSAKLTQLQNRMTILVSAGGIGLLIEKVGAYLFKFQDQIVARNEDFFRTNQFINGLEIQEKQAEVVKNFAAAMDTIYSTASKPEQDMIYNLVKGMLLDYIDFQLEKK